MIQDVDGFSGVPLLLIMENLCTVINLLFRQDRKSPLYGENRKLFIKPAIKGRKRNHENTKNGCLAVVGGAVCFAFAARMRTAE